MLTSGSIGWFATICISCLVFGHSGLFLVGAIFILIAGLITPTVGTATVGGGPHGDIRPTDLDWFPVKIDVDGGSRLAKTYHALMNLFKPGTYLIITRFMLRVIKWFLGIEGNEFNYWKVFKRLGVFYLIAIPYPAAFLAPVSYKQADPTIQLGIAGLIFILANVLGDLISSRITLGNFTNVLKQFDEINQAKVEDHWQQGFKFELALYLTTLRDLAASLAVLCFVLIVSNVMFGIQVGLYSFGTDAETLKMMWYRATHFYELANELFWLRGPDGIPEPGKGVPGMFIYGVTTFLPTLLMLATALIWTLTIPLRVVLQVPRSKLFRIVAGELSVIAICIAISATFDLSITNLYSFLTTMWAT